MDEISNLTVRIEELKNVLGESKVCGVAFVILQS